MIPLPQRGLQRKINPYQTRVYPPPLEAPSLLLPGRSPVSGPDAGNAAFAMFRVLISPVLLPIVHIDSQMSEPLFCKD